MPKIDEKDIGQSHDAEKKRSETLYSSNKTDATVDDFKVLAVLGRGSFGKVLLVEHVSDAGQLLAMKSLRKDTLLERHQVDRTKTEKDILAYADHPNLVSLKWCFQTADKVFFVMDFMQGGELFFHLKEKRRFPEDHVRL